MKVTEEEFGGKLVILENGDNLKAVPKSHQKLITAEIETWWADPVREVRRISELAVSPQMKAWFYAMADHGNWRLELHKSSRGWMQAGFCFTCTGIRGAEVAPPPNVQALDHLPQQLADYYRLVGYVDWMGFGAAGELYGPSQHEPLTVFGWKDHGPGIDPERTFTLGSGPGGDVLIYTHDGKGGWLCHENGHVHLLGSVLDTIDWVYGELLANRCPDYDYNW